MTRLRSWQQSSPQKQRRQIDKFVGVIEKINASDNRQWGGERPED
jgi:hypothetical protein